MFYISAFKVIKIHAINTIQYNAQDLTKLIIVEYAN